MEIDFSKPTKDDKERKILFDHFQAVGYNGLQLKADQYFSYLDNPKAFKENYEALIKADLALIVGGGLHDEGIAFLKKVILFGKCINADMVVFCHSVSRQKVSKSDIQEFSRILSDVGQWSFQNGVKLSLHHHFNQPVMYRDDLDVFFSGIANGAVGLTIDTAHLVKSGIQDIPAVIHEFRDVIDNFHLKDIARGDFKVLGEGEINFEPIFSAINEIGYDGRICADEESGSSAVLLNMKNGYGFIKTGLEYKN